MYNSGNSAAQTMEYKVKKTIYKVNSDNYQNAYMTAEAYKALTFCMSSGDHGSHRAIKVSKAPKGEQLLTLDDIDPDASIIKVLKTYPKDLQDYAAKASFRAGMSRGGLDSYSNYQPRTDYKAKYIPAIHKRVIAIGEVIHE